MKIIQLTGSIVATGVTYYMNELKYAFINAGHDVDTYFCEANTAEKRNANNLSKGIKQFNYTSEELDYINSADYVFIHSLMLKRNNPEYVNAFNELITKKITTKKVLFLNAHYKVHYSAFGLELFNDKEFMNSFDFICTFSPNTDISNIIKNTIGKDAFKLKFISLHHPMRFDDSYKSKWLPFDEKKRRVAYIGRYASFKKPQKILDMCKYDTSNFFEYEMRGIDKSIGVVAVPDLFYDIDTSKKYASFKDSILGPSKYTVSITKSWKKEHNLAENDLLIDYPRNNKMFIFGPYDREDGLTAMRSSMFGIECFCPKNANPIYDIPNILPGNTLEYAMMEIILCGSIPIFDITTGKSAKIIDVNTKQEKSLFDASAGLFLKDDNSNMGEIFEKMKEISSNKKLYDDMRENNWEYYKSVTDPLSVVENFVSQLTANRIINKNKLF